MLLNSFWIAVILILSALSVLLRTCRSIGVQKFYYVNALNLKSDHILHIVPSGKV